MEDAWCLHERYRKSLLLSLSYVEISRLTMVNGWFHQWTAICLVNDFRVFFHLPHVISIDIRNLRGATWCHPLTSMETHIQKPHSQWVGVRETLQDFPYLTRKYHGLPYIPWEIPWFPTDFPTSHGKAMACYRISQSPEEFTAIRARRSCELDSLARQTEEEELTMRPMTLRSRRCKTETDHDWSNHDWLVVWLPSILNFPMTIGNGIIIPIDEQTNFSEGWRKTTNQIQSW